MAGLIATWIVRGPVAGGDPRRDAEAALGVDAHRERGGQLFAVPVGHLGQAELVAPLAGEREADETPPVQRHEVDRLGRDQLRRADEVALVLAVLVVGHDDDLAVAQVLNSLLDGAESTHGSVPEEQCPHVLPDRVGLEVHPVARPPVGQSRVL